MDPRFPPEVLLEISSWLLDLYTSIPERRGRLGHILASWRSLSQSCRLFRTVFLPHLWSHLDTFFDGENSKVERRMREIIEAQYLLDHIKSMSLSLHWPALSNPFGVKALLDCMKACPKLETVKIHCSPQSDGLQTFDWVSEAFRSYSFPSVRKVVLPNVLAKILPSFPHIRSLGCGENDSMAGLALMPVASRHCPHVVEFVNLSRGMFRFLTIGMPYLERLILHDTLLETDFVSLRPMTNLCYLEFVHRDIYGQSFRDDSAKRARELLGSSRNPKTKTICIKTFKGHTNTVLSVTTITLP
ncbi:hypothetical protein B0H12DRAFT_1230940 [Mycena haematopus]|nr:hypothetical protein B0H12DRAFT_1230940 [Mycena haematopus]